MKVLVTNLSATILAVPEPFSLHLRPNKGVEVSLNDAQVARAKESKLVNKLINARLMSLVFDPDGAASVLANPAGPRPIPDQRTLAPTVTLVDPAAPPVQPRKAKEAAQNGLKFLEETLAHEPAAEVDGPPEFLTVDDLPAEAVEAPVVEEPKAESKPKKSKKKAAEAEAPVEAAPAEAGPAEAPAAEEAPAAPEASVEVAPVDTESTPSEPPAAAPTEPVDTDGGAPEPKPKKSKKKQ